MPQMCTNELMIRQISIPNDYLKIIIYRKKHVMLLHKQTCDTTLNHYQNWLNRIDILVVLRYKYVFAMNVEEGSETFEYVLECIAA